MDLDLTAFFVLLPVAFFIGVGLRGHCVTEFWSKDRCSLDLNGQELPSEGLVDGLLIVDPISSNVRFADERAALFYGISSKELVGRKYASLLSDNKRSSHAYVPGEVHYEEHRNAEGVGVKVYTTTSSVRYRGRDALLVAVKNVQERSDKEQKAEVRKEVIDATYNGVGILRLDNEDVCPLIDANPALVRALEMPEDKVIGAPFFDLLPEEKDRRAIKERMFRGEGWSGELRVDDGKGERWFIMSIDPMKASDDDASFFAVVCQDITEKRLAENRLVDAIVQTQQRERKRMANDLHDGVGQTLTAANVYLKSMEKKWRKGEPEKAMHHLPMVSELVHKGVGEIRSISHDLMPDTLKEYGLVRAVRQMIQEVEEGAEGIRISFNTKLDPEKSRNELIEGTMYRICQEILNNVIRHAEASRLDLELKEQDGILQLEAHDDGKGFDPEESSRKGGSGITGLRERVASVNGSVEVDAAIGKGTFFRVCLPLNTEQRIWERNIPLV